MLFLKSLAAGMLSVVLMWIIIVAFSMYRWAQASKSETGLVAHAGGWDSLLHMRIVLVLLTLAFGLGLYAVNARH
jgi:hypothetical protein